VRKKVMVITGISLFCNKHVKYTLYGSKEIKTSVCKEATHSLNKRHKFHHNTFEYFSIINLTKCTTIYQILQNMKKLS
jgi:hypothetical protein